MNINERLAWKNFCETGKVEDYIKYSQLKSQSGVLSGMLQEAMDADTDNRADNQRADSGRERPFGNGVNS